MASPVVVMNRPGAAAKIGTHQVAIAAPDGVAPRIDGTQLGPDMKVNPAGAQRRTVRERGQRAGQLGFGHAELR